MTQNIIDRVHHLARKDKCKDGMMFGNANNEATTRNFKCNPNNEDDKASNNNHPAATDLADMTTLLFGEDPQDTEQENNQDSDNNHCGALVDGEDDAGGAIDGGINDDNAALDATVNDESAPKVLDNNSAGLVSDSDDAGTTAKDKSNKQDDAEQTPHNTTRLSKTTAARLPDAAGQPTMTQRLVNIPSSAQEDGQWPCADPRRSKRLES